VIDSHASAKPLAVKKPERELWNNSTIPELYQAVDLLLSNPVQFVRAEPMEPMRAPDKLPGGQYYATQADGHRMLCNADGSRSIFDDVDE